jgi:hypothetical protein
MFLKRRPDDSCLQICIAICNINYRKTVSDSLRLTVKLWQVSDRVHSETDAPPVFGKGIRSTRVPCGTLLPLLCTVDVKEVIACFDGVI